MAFGSLVTVSWRDKMAPNIVAFIAICYFGNRKKSAGAKSGDLGGCDNTGLNLLAKNSKTTPEECAGALLCRRYQDQLS
jgi:hypothetical protein